MCVCVRAGCRYELLPVLAEGARQLLRDHTQGGGGGGVDGGGGGGGGGDTNGVPCRFVCGDMLAADLRGVGVVMLASQCWDAHLIRRTYAKLAAELAVGSLVVDYRDPPATATATGTGTGSAAGCGGGSGSAGGGAARATEPSVAAGVGAGVAGAGAASGAGRLVVRARVRAPVSWNPHQVFVVMERV